MSALPLFQLALRSGLPLITVRTTDVLNVRGILHHVYPADWELWAGRITGTGRYFFIGDVEMSPRIWGLLVSNDSTLVVVNPSEPIPEAFDAGELPVPTPLVEEVLKNVLLEEEVPNFMRSVSGLTLKQVAEVIRLTQAQHGQMTPALVMKTRAHLTGSLPGLVPVDTKLDLYVPDVKLDAWAKDNKPYFIMPPNPKLIPRGIIIEGPPGVGKTQGAKFVANTMEVPLYRLDLSSSLGKYVGESEANLSRALMAIDHEEPCVLLIDEVEKLFSEKEDSGVTQRLLAQLLWWLQEHVSRVLTIMTTNDIDRLPRELYRAGRLDQTLALDRLDQDGALKLAQLVLLSILPKIDPEKVVLVREAIIQKMWKGTSAESQRFSHAEVVEEVKRQIKTNNWSKE